VEPIIRAVVDANIILRYLLEDVPAQADAAEAMLEGIHSGETRVLCDPVTLAEVVHALKRGYKLEPAHIVQSLWSLVIAPGFLITNKPLYLSALRLFATSVPHFGDACACATAIGECEGRLYSFDKKLSHVEGVTRLERPSKS
jgi:predicted nucleic acid-binding protein